MDKISIIVPCYNVEKYVGKCIESLLAQTIGRDKLELIFINDASTDGTLRILKAYERMDPEHICVITYDENIKQGGARNVGLSYATGNYIGFVDADDWIEPDMYERLLTMVKKYNCDMVCCDMDWRNSVVGYTPSKRSLKEEVYPTGNTREEYPFFFNEEYPSCPIVTQLYSSKIIQKSGIRFPERLAYEDNYWGDLMSLYLQKIVYIPYPFYHYNVHEGSTIQARNDPQHLDRLNIEIMKLQEFKKRGLMAKYYDRIEASFMEMFYFNTLHILFTRFDKIPDIFPFMKETVLSEFPNVEKNPILQKKMTWMEKEELKLLRIPNKITPRDLQSIADLYREILGECQRIQNNNI